MRLVRCAVGRVFFFFFFNDTATTEIYTLSLHDALPIYIEHFRPGKPSPTHDERLQPRSEEHTSELQSHSFISYAVFCLKKNKKRTQATHQSLAAQMHPLYKLCN